MSQTFEDLNDHIVFTKAKSRSEALSMKDDAKEASSQKNVVIFFENIYHLYLMPGQDPYKIRKEIDAWTNKPKTVTTKSSAIIESSDPTATTKGKTSSSKSRLKT